MPEIKVVPLGAGQDVGRSCVLVTVGCKNIMFDCGMHMGYNDDYLLNQLRQRSERISIEIKRWFSKFAEEDYARAGFEAILDVELPEGPIDQFPHSMEPYLRQLGLPTCLQKGIVTLSAEHTVCKVGDKLTPEQAKILKLFNMPMATFKIKLLSIWSSGGLYEDL